MEVQLLDSHINEIGRSGLALDMTILPEQFAGMLRSAEVSPEHRLMVAILEDALACYLGGGKIIGLYRLSKREALHWEAERWIFGANDTLLPFSDVCNALNMDPVWLRRELEKRSASGEPYRRVKQRIVSVSQQKIEEPRKHVRCAR